MRQRFAVGAVLLCLAIAGAAFAARTADRGDRRTLQLQRYERSVAMYLNYGDAPDQLGARFDVPDARPEGPESFAVMPDGTIAVADPVHERVVVFDPNASFTRSIDGMLASDVEVSGNSLLIVDASSSRVTEVTTRGDRLRTMDVDPSVDRVTPLLRKQFEKSGRDKSDRIATQSLYAEAGDPVYYTTEIVDEYTGVLTDPATANRITINTDEALGSINVLGTDASGSVFVAIEQLLPSTEGSVNVNTEVRKYAARGHLQAVIPVDTNAAATHPRRSLVVTPDGTLYHLVPTREVVLIERFDLR